MFGDKSGTITATNHGDTTLLFAKTRPPLALIWAMARNRVIGRQNTLPWKLPADMRRFRELTTGHPIIMGRRTFASLGRPLPHRTNIVLTSDRSYTAPGCLLAHSLDQALALGEAQLSEPRSEIFVIGGENIYEQTLPRADRLYITQIDAHIEGDAWFPDFDRSAWKVLQREIHPADTTNPYSCEFLTLERQTPRTK